MVEGITLSEFFQWTATIVTITSVFYYGKPNSTSLKGPLLGLLSQFPWWGLMIVEDLWGLVVMNVFMVVTHLINFVRRFKS